MTDIYHGSDHEVRNPQHGFGKSDNDYGSGFYTTRHKDRAEDWALLYGSGKAIVNHYTIDLSPLLVLNLDDYGPLAWVTEVVANRGVSSPIAREFAAELVSRYRIDSARYDVIVGYRADDCYGEVIEAFMTGELTVDEVRRLFYKGELGTQVFIKSPRAFAALRFEESYAVEPALGARRKVADARREVTRFIENRRLAIARRYVVPPISVVDAVADAYAYNKESGCYERR